MTTDLAKRDAVKLQAGAPTPMSVLQLAVQQGATVETLRGLMELQRQWEANEARKAYVAAMAEFKANAPAIYKNRHVKFGNTEYNHATLDHIVEAITPALSKYGISHHWETSQADGLISVSCVLTHAAGHSERVTLQAMADGSGSKNGIQAIGSAVTYLERYTLLAATGLAAQGTDDDGRGAAAPKMDDLSEQLDWIAHACDIDELKKLYQQAYRKAQQVGDQNAMRAIIAAKDKRRKELGA